MHSLAHIRDADFYHQIKDLDRNRIGVLLDCHSWLCQARNDRCVSKTNRPSIDATTIFSIRSAHSKTNFETLPLDVRRNGPRQMTVAISLPTQLPNRAI